MIFDAILNRTPDLAGRRALDRPDRQALEKDRTLRYQTAADLLADLRRIERDSSSGVTAVVQAPARRRPVGAWAAGAVALVAVVAAAVRWWPTSPAPPPRDLNPVKITANPSEYPVSGAALSPDGKFLAYSDGRGLNVRVMATGETESLPDTAGMIALGWLNDGTKVTAVRQAGGEATSFWSISILGGASRKVVTQGLPAPDGATTLQVEGGELWIDGAAGRRRSPRSPTGPCRRAGVVAGQPAARA